MRWQTYLWLAAGMALFGSATPVARFVTSDVPPLVAGGLRVLIAAAVLWPLAAMRGFRFRSLDRPGWIRGWVLAIVGMFGFTTMLAFGMQRVPGATGSIVMGLAPAVTAVAAVWFMGERATWRRWLAVGLAVVGVILMRMLGTATHFDLIGVGLVFGAVLAEATYTLVGKGLMAQIDHLEAAAAATVLSLPLFVAAAAWQALHLDWHWSWHVWLGILWWGLGTLALGSVVWYLGVRQAPGHIAGVFMGVMPVSALAISYVLLAEAPRWWHGAGLGLVLAAIVLVAWDDRVTRLRDGLR